MKPSEMSLSQLSGEIDHYILQFNIENTPLNDLIEEMETRLRNSIPKPVVEVERDVDTDEYWVRVNDTPFRVYNKGSLAEIVADQLRTALGLEGGE